MWLKMCFITSRRNNEIVGLSLTNTSKVKIQNRQRKLTFHVRPMQKRRTGEKPRETEQKQPHFVGKTKTKFEEI